MSAGRQGAPIWERSVAGLGVCLEVQREVLHRKTAFQEMEIADTPTFGRVLSLDGRFMLSDRDEAFYHEMLVHPALLAHPHPQHVVVVGGGDGGALREVLAHSLVTQAVLVEIDAEVVAAAKEHLKSVHRGSLEDPRVHVVIGPGEEYVAQAREMFDVIVVDSTDPIGPGKALFSWEFFQNCRRALRPGGFLALQVGSPFYFPGEFVETLQALKAHFPVVLPYLGFVPLYPGGLWAYALAGQDDARSVPDVSRRFQGRGLKTRYYRPELQSAAFVLPQFVAELAEKAGVS